MHQKDIGFNKCSGFNIINAIYILIELCILSSNFKISVEYFCKKIYLTAKYFSLNPQYLLLKKIYT